MRNNLLWGVASGRTAEAVSAGDFPLTGPAGPAIVNAPGRERRAAVHGDPGFFLSGQITAQS